MTGYLISKKEMDSLYNRYMHMQRTLARAGAALEKAENYQRDLRTVVKGLRAAALAHHIAMEAEKAKRKRRTRNYFILGISVPLVAATITTVLVLGLSP